MAVQAQAAAEPQANPSRRRDEIREEIRLRHSNISAETLLATDYLNHFNEIIMMIEFAADMPESFDLTDGWEPLDYQEHFRRSSFSDRDLAVEAYTHCPEDIRADFDSTISTLDDHLVNGLRHAADALKTAEYAAFSFICRDLAQDARNYIDNLSSIIHGRQHQISTEEALDAESLEEAQHTIDCLFGT